MSRVQNFIDLLLSKKRGPDNTLDIDIKTSIFSALKNKGYYNFGIQGGPDCILQQLRDDGFEIVRKVK